MTSLLELQQAFAGALQGGEASVFARFVVGNGLDPARRISIYENNVRENQLGALESAFPVLARLAGRDWFRQAGRGYLQRHPSTSGNLHELGAQLAAWLESELAHGPHAYFADVARLERAYQEAMVAAEPGAIDLAALAAVPSERHTTLVLELNTSARLVRSPWPLLAIWRANQPDADPAATVSLHSSPSRLLVVRRETHIELRELPPGEFDFLAATARGATLVEAATEAVTADPGFELTSSLVRLVQQRVLTGFHLLHPHPPTGGTES